MKPLDDLQFTQENVPAREFILDNRVNPRDPSTAWARKQMGKGYSHALLGVFIGSERPAEGGGRELALLDGANRQLLMGMADDLDYPVPSLVFHGLTLKQEAQVASDYNDRRQWTGVRKFQNQVTMGDPVALRIEEIFDKGGWRVGTDSDTGVIRGVAPIERLLVTGGQWAAADVKARRGTQAWNAAMDNGRDDAFRALEQAIDIYNVVFPTRPSGYAPDIMRAFALLLLRYGDRVDLGRLTQHLADSTRGHRAFRNDAKSARDTYKFSMTDAYAFLTVTYYNIGYKKGSKEALPNWEKTGAGRN